MKRKSRDDMIAVIWECAECAYSELADGFIPSVFFFLHLPIFSSHCSSPFSLGNLREWKRQRQVSLWLFVLLNKSWSNNILVSGFPTGCFILIIITQYPLSDLSGAAGEVNQPPFLHTHTHTATRASVSFPQLPHWHHKSVTNLTIILFSFILI